jgi:DNA-directed RNA polymerase specialized sigma24 family protein
MSIAINNCVVHPLPESFVLGPPTRAAQSSEPSPPSSWHAPTTDKTAAPTSIRSTSIVTIKHLLAGCRQRDPDAESLLVRRYERFVSSVAVAKIPPALRRRLEGADIVQEVFLRLFRFLARRELACSSEREFLGYLYTFTKNLVAKRVKSQMAAKRDVRSETACEETPDIADRGALDAECQELIGIIRGAVAKEFRGSIQLDDIIQHSNTELAKKLGVSHKTVCSRIRNIWSSIYTYEPALKPSKPRRRRFRKPR